MPYIFIIRLFISGRVLGNAFKHVAIRSFAHSTKYILFYLTFVLSWYTTCHGFSDDLSQFISRIILAITKYKSFRGF